MSILLCTEAEERFSPYLDGALSGVEMAEVREHLEHCPLCHESFTHWRETVSTLSRLRPLKAPPSLQLRLRVALSQESARTAGNLLGRLGVRWRNTVAPLAVQASAGFASAVLLLGTVLLLVGTLAAPEPASARDEPIGMALPPRFLYTAAPGGSGPSATLDGSVVVRVFVDSEGRVYDFRVLSGVADARSRAALTTNLMWSVFEPARVFGEPVRGSVILSVAGVSVPG